MLEYKDNNSSGILAIGNDSFRVIQSDNILSASSVCEHLEIMNILGATIIADTNTDKLNLEMVPSGIYLVKAIKDGVTHTSKILKQ